MWVYMHSVLSVESFSLRCLSLSCRLGTFVPTPCWLT